MERNCLPATTIHVISHMTFSGFDFSIVSRAATKDYFGCRLIYRLFFRLVMIILTASVSTLVLPHVLRANYKPMKHVFENII